MVRIQAVEHAWSSIMRHAMELRSLAICRVPVCGSVRSACEIMTLHPPLTAATLSCGAAEQGVEMLQEGSLGHGSAHGQSNAACVNGSAFLIKVRGGSSKLGVMSSIS